MNWEHESTQLAPVFEKLDAERAALGKKEMQRWRVQPTQSKGEEILNKQRAIER